MPAKGWKKENGKEILFTFRTTTEWRDAIKEIADAHGISVAKLLIEATQQYCDRNGFASIIQNVRL